MELLELRSQVEVTFGMWELFLVLLSLKQIRFFLGFFLAVSISFPYLDRRGNHPRLHSEVLCFPGTAFEAGARALFIVSTFSQCASRHSKLSKPQIENLRTPFLAKCANHRCTLVNFFESSFSEFSVLTVHDGYLNTQSE